MVGIVSSSGLTLRMKSESFLAALKKSHRHSGSASNQTLKRKFPRTDELQKGKKLE
jgi:hypothetical protein